MPNKRGKASRKKESAPNKTKKRKKISVKVFSDRTNQDDNELILIEKNTAEESRLNYSYNEKAEQKNKLVMWVCIGCIMLAFFIAWIFNLKNEFKASVKNISGNGLNWSQARAELDKTMDQVKQGIAQIKKIQENATSTPLKEKELTPEQINSLKSRLLQEIATSTASSTIK